MSSKMFQSSIKNRGLVLDPRTKFFLLFTMSMFVLGGAGGKFLGYLMPIFCIVPAVALFSANRIKTAITYLLLYSISIFTLYFFGNSTYGVINFLVLGICGILSRFLPCIMMGSYLISTTTVSEFTAAMLRLRMSEKIIIPLSVMFRFFPTVLDEFRSINTAMKMRGIQFGKVGIAKLIEYRIVPLMTCCVKIGEELSAAALTRGLGGEVKRTNICKIGFHIQDIIVLIICVIPYILLVFQLLKPHI